MKPITFATFLFSLLLPLSAQQFRTHPAPGLGDYTEPFIAPDQVRPDIQSPDAFFGFPLGARPLHHHEVQAYYRYLSDLLPNAELHTYGQTYEGRELFYLVLSSPENMQRLDAIREANRKLADPRLLAGATQADRIIDTNPAIAWLGYAIHGDELSSTDAAVQLAYQLLAGTDETSRKIRREVVVCLDPLQNPDGRERYLHQLEQWSGVVVNSDVQSLSHTGLWPWGRGNHYLFDLNRDWLATVHPETRGKVQAALEWQPQLVVDAHEMGAFDTYLFNPPREPFNPYLPEPTHKWWSRFAQDQAKAFDQHGWSYYTREWNEELFPGYGSSWGIYAGLVGILYEQAGTDGSLVKRPDETLTPFREAVHHQLTSSIANLKTLADNRKEILRDYYQHRRQAVAEEYAAQAFLFPPAENRTRLTRFAEMLQRQQIEVFQLPHTTAVPAAVSGEGTRTENLELPAGTLVVPLRQPLQAIIRNMLTFDIRIDTRSLERERRELLKNNRSTIYDVTAWSLPLAYGISAYFTESLPPRTDLVPYQPPVVSGKLINPEPRFGWVLDGTDDQIYTALARLLERGVKVWCARKTFTVAGQTYPAGSLLIKRRANPDLDPEFLRSVAAASGIDITGVDTGLATDGPDLGGREFTLLREPRIALLGGPPASAYSFGATWHLLDSRLQTRITLLALSDFNRRDLDKYNVLILPSVWGNPLSYQEVFGQQGLQKLKAWVRNGGTLIAVGNGAAFLADTAVAVSSVRLRRQVLDKLDEYRRDLERRKAAEQPRVDSLALWEGSTPTATDTVVPPESKPKEERERDDELGRLLRPQGAILKATLDPEHWLAFGCGEAVTVLYNTSYVLLAKKPIQVPARLAAAEQLRLSGLVWPEAGRRIAESAWATREGVGEGQIILFATQPNFRAQFHSSERVFLNALYLGPGLGTRAKVKW
jgi:hypothetical protein